MKVSVITVCRNAAETIEDTLRSVQSQLNVRVEHIVIDGASSDGTLAILERYRNGISTLVSEPDAGVYHAMNRGLAFATGEVVGFLNADDFYAHESVLSRIAAQFINPSVSACFADLVYVDRRDTARVRRYWRSRPYQDGLCERGWMPAHPTFYVRRVEYTRYGGFDTRYRFQADFDLCVRLLAVKRIPSVYVPEVWVNMRTGGMSNGSFRNVMRGNIEAWRAARNSGLRVRPFFILQKVLSRIPQFFARPHP